METLRTWLSKNILLLAVLGGAAVAVIGFTIFVGIIASAYIGIPAGLCLAATVGGVATARGALLWSRLAIVEEAGR